MMKFKRVGFTGTQEGMTPLQKAALKSVLLQFHDFEFHHGDCIGADAEAHAMLQTQARGTSMCRRIVIHPPTQDKKRAFTTHEENWVIPFTVRVKKDYMHRNADILAESEILLVGPKTMEEELRSGTWSTWRHAKKAFKPYIIVFPDGSLESKASYPDSRSLFAVKPTQGP